MEAVQYEVDFGARMGWHHDPLVCPCKGRGFVLSECDVWHECAVHKGCPHPEAEDDEAPEAHEARRLNQLRESFRRYRAAGRRLREGFDGLVAAVRRETFQDTPEGWVCAAALALDSLDP